MPEKPLCVLAVGAHPDDIEFMMAGTLLLLGELGAELHMWNLANGHCGTDKLSREEIIATRWAEAQESAKVAGAQMHAPISDDLAILYSPELLAKCAAVVRQVKPDLLLVPSLEDYMEDHQNTARLMVTAAFARGMTNFATDPPVEAWSGEVVVYHALPYGLHDGMRRLIRPECYVDITSVLSTKRKMLACHKSQKEWLDASQGLDAYLNEMETMSRKVGELSGRFEFAEGWRRHNNLGFAALEADPLAELLSNRTWCDPEYAEKLEGGR